MFTLSPQEFNHAAFAVDANRLQRRCQCVILSPVRRGQQENPRLIVIQSAQPHQFALTDQRGNCKAVPHRLAKSGKMRHDAMKLLCPA